MPKLVSKSIILIDGFSKNIYKPLAVHSEKKSIYEQKSGVGMIFNVPERLLCSPKLHLFV